MPSDARVAAALAAAEPQILAFQAALAAAADRLDAQLESAVEDPAHVRVATELGEFAAGRIDITRFAALSQEPEALDDHELALLRRSRDLLREQAALPLARFVVDVPSGGRLCGALGHAFAELGAAYGAMLVAELVRTRRYDAAAHSFLLHSLPRHQWNRAERAAAPPMVMWVDGADLWGGEIAQYLDGGQKIVIVVRPPMSPAPLVRLITPGTYVRQTTSTEHLTEALALDGPAVVALVPEGSAEFVHRPDARQPMHARVHISTRPQGARKTLQSWTAWQQQEELAQLDALAAEPAPAVIPALAQANAVSPPADPADQLARWLLSRADLATAQA